MDVLTNDFVTNSIINKLPICEVCGEIMIPIVDKRGNVGSMVSCRNLYCTAYKKSLSAKIKIDN